MSNPSRALWTHLADQQLLAQCAVDTYRASGPGGQKRNKTSSAVRLRHPGSGLMVIAEESRSQHENRARALRRLRQALYLQIRDELGPEDLTPAALQAHPDYPLLQANSGRWHLGHKDPRFWPAVGLVLDLLQARQGRVSETAGLLGISTANLIDFLSVDPKVWTQANQMRTRVGLKPLKSS